jgi:hypothetical protein
MLLRKVVARYSGDRRMDPDRAAECIRPIAAHRAPSLIDPGRIVIAGIVTMWPLTRRRMRRTKFRDSTLAYGALVEVERVRRRPRPEAPMTTPSSRADER